MRTCHKELLGNVCKIAQPTGFEPGHSGSRARPLDRDSALSHLEVGVCIQYLSHGSGKQACARHGNLLSLMGSSLSFGWEIWVLVMLANPKFLWPHLKNRYDSYSYFYINYVKPWTQCSYLKSYTHYNRRGPALVIPAVQGARSLALRLGQGEWALGLSFLLWCLSLSLTGLRVLECCEQQQQQLWMSAVTLAVLRKLPLNRMGLFAWWDSQILLEKWTWHYWVSLQERDFHYF